VRINLELFTASVVAVCVGNLSAENHSADHPGDRIYLARWFVTNLIRQ